jgi:integrase/recombinase XerD
MDWIEEFRVALQKDGKSHNTVINYCSDIREYLIWFMDTYAKNFDGKILEQDAREYRNYLHNIIKLKPSSVNRKMTALKSYNQFLINLGTGTETAIYGISIADTHDREIQTIERNELNRFRRAVYSNGNKRDIAIIELLINTGIRVSELVSLTLDDIHITQRNGSQNYSYIIIRNGKGGKYREVPLNAQAKKAIEEYTSNRNYHHKKLFLGQRGPLRRETIDKIIKKYCRIAEIESFSAHTLRHTFCTRLMSKNVPISIISKLAGHSSIQTTVNFYVNVSRKNKMDAVNKLNML